jgi:autotransporter-associated beta strand protein
MYVPLRTRWSLRFFADFLRARQVVARALLVSVLVFAFNAQAAVRNWTGAAVDTLWTSVGNWDTAVPVNGDDLLFSGGLGLANSNNITNLSIHSLGFTGSGYSLAGNALTITSGLYDSGGLNTNRINLILGTSQMFTSSIGGLVLVGNITNGPNNLTLQADADLTISGIIGNGAGGVIKRGVSTLILSGANTFQGGLTINEGQVNLGNANAVPNGAGVGDVTVATGAVLDIADGNRTINGLNGAGTVQNTGAGTDTLTIGANATNSAGTFTGTLQDGTGLLALTKASSNTFTFNGTGNHSGPTTISGGTLVLGPAGMLPVTPNISIAPGAVIDISGSTFTLGSAQQLIGGRATNGGPADVVGSLTNAGTIAIRSSGTAGTLTIGGGLTLQGGAVGFDLRNNTAIGGGTNDLITIGGPLNLASPTFIKPSFLDGTFAAGAYTLVNGVTAHAGSIANLNAVLPRGINTTFTTPASSLQMSLTGTPTPGRLVWTAGTWDVGVSQSWLNNGSPDIFLTFDNVIFDDTGDGTVTVQDSVTPSSMTISNETVAYTFPGPASISGSGSLTQYGNGQVAFTGPGNTYSGPTIINGGELFLDWRTQISVVPVNNLLYAGDVTNTLTLSGDAQLTLQSGGGITHGQYFAGLIIGSGINQSFGPGRTANDMIAVYYGPVTRPNAGGMMYMNMVQREAGDLTGEWASNPVGPIGGYAVKGIAPVTAWAAVTTTAQTNINGSIQGWINGYAHTAGETGANAFLTNTHNVDMTANRSATNRTVNSIRFLSANRTLTLSGTNTISNGGILSASGAGTATINGGNLRSGNDADLIIQQHNAGQPLVINSVIEDNGGATNLTKAGPGLVALAADNTYSGTTYILEGTVQLGNGGTNGSIPNLTAIVNRGTFAYKRSDNVTHAALLTGTGGFATFGTGILSLTSDATYQGPTTVGAGATLHVGNGGTTGSINNSPTINVGSGGTVAFNRSDALVYDGSITSAGSLAKLGAGKVTLNGTLDYAGNTIVGAGTLALGGGATLSTSPTIRVDGGATLDMTAVGGLTLNAAVPQTLSGSGAVSGNVICPAGTKVSPGTTLGSLTFNNDLTMNGGTIVVELSNATNDTLRVLGSLTLNSGLFQVVIVGGTVANGAYPLFTVPTLIGSLENMTVIGLPPTQDGLVIQSAPGVYSLVVLATTAPTLVWRGDGAANLWDLNATANWRSNGVATVFLNNLFASFNDTGSNNVPVSLVGTLLPKAVTVNAAGNYTFAGSGKISSSATLDKLGVGTLTIATLNDNFGDTTISGGTVQVGNGSSAGAIGSAQLINNSALVFNQPVDHTNTSIISGTGTLTKQDTNVLSLTGNSTYTNLTTAKGTLKVGDSGVVGTLASVVNLVADVQDLGGGVFQTNLATLAFNRSGTISQGLVQGDGNLANYGPGTVILTASNSYTGDTILGNGGNGTIVQGVAGAIPGGPGFGNVVGTTGTDVLDLNGFNTTLNLLNGTGGFIGNDSGANIVTLTLGANGASGGSFAGVLRDHAVGSGILRVVKVGPGSQTLSSANSFTGGLRVEGGELDLRNNNAGGANANMIEFDGGNLRTFGGMTFNANATYPNQTATLAFLTNTLVTMEGIWVLNTPISGPSNVTITIANTTGGRLDWGQTMNGSTFAGTIKFSDDSIGGVRVVSQNGWRGSPNVTFDFGQSSVGIGPRNRSLIMSLGALIGGPNSFLNAGSSSDQINDPNIYVIGGKNLDTEFQGSINDNTPGNNGAPRLTKIWKEGTGKLILSGNLNYTAGTTVSNGVLFLTNLAYIHNVSVLSNVVNVYSGAAATYQQPPTNCALTLAAPGILDVTAVTAGPAPGAVVLGDTDVEQIVRGDGTIRGSLTMLGNSTLTPGFSIGTLTVTDRLSIGGTTVIELNRAGTPNSDRLVANSINYGGTLIVTNIGADLVAGDTFTLISAPTRGGSFASISLPTLNSGLFWTNRLGTDGTLSVGSTGPTVDPSPIDITFVAADNTLDMSWPSSHIGWDLQSNSVDIANPNFWFTLPGSAATNRVIITVDPAKTNVFYRMHLQLP